MRRARLLVAAVLAVFVVAVGLRVRSQWTRPQVVLLAKGLPQTQPVPIPVPHDYVAEPMVSPDEAGNGPSRIVSLAPSITEILCALGLRDRLVARSTYCTYPPGIESVVSVGSLMDANLAKLEALKPELILVTTNSGPLLDKLAKLGLRCEAVPHESLAGVYEAIEMIGGWCARPKTAHQLVEAIKADVGSIRAWVEQQAQMPRRRVLVVFGPLPVPPQAVFVAGPGIFFDTLVEAAGHTNAAREALKSPQGEIPLEKLRLIDPEVILEFREEVSDAIMTEVYASWSQVGSLAAIQNQRVRAVGGLEWLSAGPRVAILLHRLVAVLWEFR